MKEKWAPVPGFGDRYEVSDAGRLRVITTKHVVRGRPDRDGYLIADVWDGSTYHTIKLHRLVLLAFVGEPPEGRPIADHINRNRTDNRLSNLRWVSSSENGRNRTVSGGQSGVSGVRYRAGKPRPWQAYAHNGRFVNIGHFLTAREAVAAREKYRQEHGI